MSESSAPSLSSTQRKFLRGRAHSLKPVVTLGKEGVSDSLVRETAVALQTHELIKVKLLGYDRRERDDLVLELSDKVGATVAGTVGRIAVLFKPAADPEDRRIEVPDA